MSLRVCRSFRRDPLQPHRDPHPCKPRTPLVTGPCHASLPTRPSGHSRPRLPGPRAGGTSFAQLALGGTQNSLPLSSRSSVKFPALSEHIKGSGKGFVGSPWFVRKRMMGKDSQTLWLFEQAASEGGATLEEKASVVRSLVPTAPACPSLRSTGSGTPPTSFFKTGSREKVNNT